MDEADLMAAYKGTSPVSPEGRHPRADSGIVVGTITFTQCSCGSWLGLDSRDPKQFRQTLRDHDTTARHRAWAVLRG